MNNLQTYCKDILQQYVNARTQFLREELAKVRAEELRSKGDILYLISIHAPVKARPP